MNKKVLIPFVLLLLTNTLYGQSDVIMADIGPCVFLQSAIERFNCYESVAAEVLTNSSGVQNQVRNAPVRRAAPQAERNFRQNEGSTARTIPVLRSVISEAREIEPDLFSVTLENDHVWQQVRPQTGVNLRAGQQITIAPSQNGDDYQMTIAESGDSILVQRIR